MKAQANFLPFSCGDLQVCLAAIVLGLISERIFSKRSVFGGNHDGCYAE